MSKFTGAKACFAENINDYLPQPNRLAKLAKDDALMWNLNKGLHSLATAIEQRFDELDARIQRLEQALQRSR
jgi:hypothetical protein